MSKGESPDTRIKSPDIRSESPDIRIESPGTRIESPDTRIESPGASLGWAGGHLGPKRRKGDKKVVRGTPRVGTFSENLCVILRISSCKKLMQFDAVHAGRGGGSP